MSCTRRGPTKNDLVLKFKILNIKKGPKPPTITTPVTHIKPAFRSFFFFFFFPLLSFLIQIISTVHRIFSHFQQVAITYIHIRHTLQLPSKTRFYKRYNLPSLWLLSGLKPISCLFKFHSTKIRKAIDHVLILLDNIKFITAIPVAARKTY